MQYSLVSSPWLKKMAPILLTAGAGIGVVGTAVLAAKATPKAIEKKEEAEAEKGEPLTTLEKVKVMGPSYIPAATTGLATIGCVAGIVIDSNKKQAELGAVIASGNQIINRVSTKYGALRSKVQEKDPELIKEFDQKTLDDEWNEYVHERMKKKGYCIHNECFPIEDPSEWGQTMMMAFEYGNGLADENGHEMIFFESTPGDVMAALYNINGIFQEKGEVCWNDVFKQVGLPNTELGNRLVWSADVLNEEWEANFIGFNTEELLLEDPKMVPEPATCILIVPCIPPLSSDYTVESRYLW